MAKTFLFVKDKKTDEVISVYQYDEARFSSQRALLDSIITEKRNIERLFPGSRFLIEQATGEDISFIAKMFPQIVGRSNIKELHDKVVSPDISRYIEVSLTYYIEENGEDRVLEKHIIQGGTIPISLILKEIGIVGNALEVNDLSDLELKVATTEPNQIKLSLLSRMGSKFYVGVNLWPPVEKDEKREVRLEYKWKGLWQPFRKEGHDQGFHDIGTVADTLVINVVLPLGIEAELLRESDIGDYEIIDCEDRRKKLVWRVENAPPGRYSYRVKRVT